MELQVSISKDNKRLKCVHKSKLTRFLKTKRKRCMSVFISRRTSHHFRGRKFWSSILPLRFLEQLFISMSLSFLPSAEMRVLPSGRAGDAVKRFGSSEGFTHCQAALSSRLLLSLLCIHSACLWGVAEEAGVG